MSKGNTEDSLKRILDDKLKPLQDNFTELIKTVEFISAKYDDLLSKQKNIEAVSDGLAKENDLLKNEVFNLQNHVECKCKRLRAIYGRRECLEIRGIPFREDGQLNDVVYSTGSIINVNIKPEDISISHRL